MMAMSYNLINRSSAECKPSDESSCSSETTDFSIYEDVLSIIWEETSQDLRSVSARRKRRNTFSKPSSKNVFTDLSKNHRQDSDDDHDDWLEAFNRGEPGQVKVVFDEGLLKNQNNCWEENLNDSRRSIITMTSCRTGKDVQIPLADDEFTFESCSTDFDLNSNVSIDTHSLPDIAEEIDELEKCEYSDALKEEIEILMQAGVAVRAAQEPQDNADKTDNMSGAKESKPRVKLLGLGYFENRLSRKILSADDVLSLGPLPREAMFASNKKQLEQALHKSECRYSHCLQSSCSGMDSLQLRNEVKPIFEYMDGNLRRSKFILVKKVISEKIPGIVSARKRQEQNAKAQDDQQVPTTDSRTPTRLERRHSIRNKIHKLEKRLHELGFSLGLDLSLHGDESSSKCTPMKEVSSSQNKVPDLPMQSLFSDRLVRKQIRRQESLRKLQEALDLVSTACSSSPQHLHRTVTG